MSYVCKRGYKCMCFQCGEKDCECFESEPPELCEDCIENGADLCVFDGICRKSPTGRMPVKSDDAVSRQAVFDILSVYDSNKHLKVPDAEAMRNLQIAILPSAQPERKKGKWHKPTGMMPPEYAGVFRCSKCDEFAMRDWKTHKQMLTDFCPNCGADMRGEQDD